MVSLGAMWVILHAEMRSHYNQRVRSVSEHRGGQPQASFFDQREKPGRPPQAAPVCPHHTCPWKREGSPHRSEHPWEAQARLFTPPSTLSCLTSYWGRRWGLRVR